MKGEVKARAIVEHSLGREFAYIGNDHADIPIWNQAHEVIYVGDSPAITSHIMRSYSTATIIDPGKKSGLIEYINEIRMYQWVKNTLVFIPALLAHVMNFEIFTSLTLTFFVFGLLASSVYVMNDILDLHSDRMHPRKKHRPIASGQIAIPNGISLYI
jgi:hypothetical protein